MLKSYWGKFDDQLLKPFSLCASSALLIAIALSATVHAEEQLQAANNSTSKINAPFNQEPIHPARTLKQASLLAEPSELSTEPRDFESIALPLPLNPVAQADAPSSQLGSSDSDQWRFSVAPYFFIPLRVRADATVAGRSASINLGLGSILNFDRAYDVGLRLEAQKSRLGFILDGFYVFARQSGNLGVTFPQGSLQRFGINAPARVNAGASLSVRQGTVDLAASYRVVDTSLGNSVASSSPYPRWLVAPILGLRINILSQKLEVDNIGIGNLLLPINQDFSFSRTFVEPLIGAQIGLDLSKRWAVGIRGDVSGFNISADRNLTWNLLVAARYHLSPSTSLQLGYRFNNFDFEDGSGLRRTKVDLRQNGLLLNVVFRF